MFLGFDFPRLRLGLVNYWACQRLIHDPTVTPQFSCPNDYGNFGVPKEWIKLSMSTLISGLGFLLRLDQFRGLVEKINFEAEKFRISKIF
jgi:hypothetical protein